MTEVRLYRKRMPVFWWVRKPTYFLFVMRELSSFFVAWFVVYLLLLLHAVSQGKSAYRDFIADADAPWLVALNLLGFALVVLHTVTWFHLTPKAMVLQVPRHPRVPARLQGWTAPPWLIIGSQYLGFVAVTVLIALAVTW
ncbi:MAG: fumarate reductase subunit C [Actinobacteria bacterium]|nr:fumarate reductase subunit C [Actinomycetota bacterium]